MSEVELACVLKYLIKGVITSRESQGDLQRELHEVLPSATAITILPVVEGYSVEMEFATLAPFSRSSFEPFIAEQVLPEAVASQCEALGDVSFALLKAFYP